MAEVHAGPHPSRQSFSFSRFRGYDWTAVLLVDRVALLRSLPASRADRAYSAAGELCVAEHAALGTLTCVRWGNAVEQSDSPRCDLAVGAERGFAIYRLRSAGASALAAPQWTLSCVIHTVQPVNCLAWSPLGSLVLAGTSCASLWSLSPPRAAVQAPGGEWDGIDGEDPSPRESDSGDDSNGEEDDVIGDVEDAEETARIGAFAADRLHARSSRAAVQLDADVVWRSSGRSGGVHHCDFSPDGRLFFTAGEHDRLPRVWFRAPHAAGFAHRRLPHPHGVLMLAWRPPTMRRRDAVSEDASMSSVASFGEVHGRGGQGASKTLDAVRAALAVARATLQRPTALLTLARDGLVRVWEESSLHSPFDFSLVATLSPATGQPSADSALAAGWVRHERLDEVATSEAARSVAAEAVRAVRAELRETEWRAAAASGAEPEPGTGKEQASEGEGGPPAGGPPPTGRRPLPDTVLEGALDVASLGPAWLLLLLGHGHETAATHVQARFGAAKPLSAASQPPREWVACTTQRGHLVVWTLEHLCDAPRRDVAISLWGRLDLSSSLARPEPVLPIHLPHSAPDPAAAELRPLRDHELGNALARARYRAELVVSCVVAASDEARSGDRGADEEMRPPGAGSTSAPGSSSAPAKPQRQQSQQGHGAGSLRALPPPTCITILSHAHPGAGLRAALVAFDTNVPLASVARRARTGHCPWAGSLCEGHGAPIRALAALRGSSAAGDLLLAHDDAGVLSMWTLGSGPAQTLAGPASLRHLGSCPVPGSEHGGAHSLSVDAESGTVVVVCRLRRLQGAWLPDAAAVQDSTCGFAVLRTEPWAASAPVECPRLRLAAVSGPLWGRGSPWFHMRPRSVLYLSGRALAWPVAVKAAVDDEDDPPGYVLVLSGDGERVALWRVEYGEREEAEAVPTLIGESALSTPALAVSAGPLGQGQAGTEAFVRAAVRRRATGAPAEGADDAEAECHAALPCAAAVTVAYESGAVVRCLVHPPVAARDSTGGGLGSALVEEEARIAAESAAEEAAVSHEVVGQTAVPDTDAAAADVGDAAEESSVDSFFDTTSEEEGGDEEEGEGKEQAAPADRKEAGDGAAQGSDGGATQTSPWAAACVKELHTSLDEGLLTEVAVADAVEEVLTAGAASRSRFAPEVAAVRKRVRLALVPSEAHSGRARVTDRRRRTGPLGEASDASVLGGGGTGTASVANFSTVSRWTGAAPSVSSLGPSGVAPLQQSGATLVATCVVGPAGGGRDAPPTLPSLVATLVELLPAEEGEDAREAGGGVGGGAGDEDAWMDAPSLEAALRAREAARLSAGAAGLAPTAVDVVCSGARAQRALLAGAAVARPISALLSDAEVGRVRSGRGLAADLSAGGVLAGWRSVHGAASAQGRALRVFRVVLWAPARGRGQGDGRRQATAMRPVAAHILCDSPCAGPASVSWHPGVGTGAGSLVVVLPSGSRVTFSVDLAQAVGLDTDTSSPLVAESALPLRVVNVTGASRARWARRRADADVGEAGTTRWCAPPEVVVAPPAGPWTACSPVGVRASGPELVAADLARDGASAVQRAQLRPWWSAEEGGQPLSDATGWACDTHPLGAAGPAFALGAEFMLPVALREPDTPSVGRTGPLSRREGAQVAAAAAAATTKALRRSPVASAAAWATEVDWDALVRALTAPSPAALSRWCQARCRRVGLRLALACAAEARAGDLLPHAPGAVDDSGAAAPKSGWSGGPASPYALASAEEVAQKAPLAHRLASWLAPAAACVLGLEVVDKGSEGAGTDAVVQLERLLHHSADATGAVQDACWLLPGDVAGGERALPPLSDHMARCGVRADHPVVRMLAGVGSADDGSRLSAARSPAALRAAAATTSTAGVSFLRTAGALVFHPGSLVRTLWEGASGVPPVSRVLRRVVGEMEAAIARGRSDDADADSGHGPAGQGPGKARAGGWTPLWDTAWPAEAEGERSPDHDSDGGSESEGDNDGHSSVPASGQGTRWRGMAEVLEAVAGTSARVMCVPSWRVCSGEEPNPGAAAEPWTLEEARHLRDLFGRCRLAGLGAAEEMALVCLAEACARAHREYGSEERSPWRLLLGAQLRSCVRRGAAAVLATACYAELHARRRALAVETRVRRARGSSTMRGGLPDVRDGRAACTRAACRLMARVRVPVSVGEEAARWSAQTGGGAALWRFAMRASAPLPSPSEAGGGGGGGLPTAGAGGDAGIEWEDARAVHAPLWVPPGPEARAVAEAVARAQYAAAGQDPFACALLYCVAGKRVVLCGLFKLAGERKVFEFLSRDFSGDGARAAAGKNAMVLQRQHRFSLAAAFFAVAGRVREAVRLCAKQLGDPLLALLVARAADVPDAETRAELVRALVADYALPGARILAATDEACADGLGSEDDPALVVAAQRQWAAERAELVRAAAPLFAAEVGAPVPAGGAGLDALLQGAGALVSALYLQRCVLLAPSTPASTVLALATEVARTAGATPARTVAPLACALLDASARLLGDGAEPDANMVAVSLAVRLCAAVALQRVALARGRFRLALAALHPAGAAQAGPEADAALAGELSDEAALTRVGARLARAVDAGMAGPNGASKDGLVPWAAVLSVLVLRTVTAAAVVDLCRAAAHALAAPTPSNGSAHEAGAGQAAMLAATDAACQLAAACHSQVRQCEPPAPARGREAWRWLGEVAHRLPFNFRAERALWSSLDGAGAVAAEGRVLRGVTARVLARSGRGPAFAVRRGEAALLSTAPGDRVTAVCVNRTDPSQLVAATSAGLRVVEEEEVLAAWAAAEEEAVAAAREPALRSTARELVRRGAAARLAEAVPAPGPRSGWPVGAETSSVVVEDDAPPLSLDAQRAYSELLRLPQRCGAVTMATHEALRVVAHPSLPVFASGGCSGEVLLWQFQHDRPLARMVKRAPRNTPSGIAASAVGGGALAVDDLSYGAFFDASLPWTAEGGGGGPGASFAYVDPRGVRHADTGTAPIEALGISAEGDAMCACDRDGSAWLWQLDGTAASLVSFESMQCHSKSAHAVTFLGTRTAFATGGVAAAGSPRHNLALWDTLAPPGSALVAAGECHEEGVGALAYSPRHQLLVTAGRKRGVSLFCLRQRRVVWRTLPAETVTGIQIDGVDEQYALLCIEDKSVALDVAASHQQGTSPRMDGFKGRPSLDLCGDLAVLAAGNHVIALWDGGSDPN